MKRYEAIGIGLLGIFGLGYALYSGPLTADAKPPPPMTLRTLTPDQGSCRLDLAGRARVVAYGA